KRTYFHNLFNAEIMKRSDVMWQRLNAVLGRKQQHTQSVQELILNGLPVSGTPLADSFNNFFVSLANSTHNPLSLEYLKSRNRESAFLRPTDADEIHQIFLSFRNSSCCDADDLQIRPVKHVLDIICPVLE
ncbi:unnamed protein product, partial [Ixodes pacificus]